MQNTMQASYNIGLYGKACYFENLAFTDDRLLFPTLKQICIFYQFH